jgi:alkyl sulfatase BDS1-like metallo-beta-lactamase superfamily hydrolase
MSVPRTTSPEGSRLPSRKTVLTFAAGLLAGALLTAGGRYALIALRGSGRDPTIPLRYQVSTSIDPELREHGRLFEKKIHTVGDRVHCAVGFGLANIVFVEGDDGVIVVDTGENVAQAREALAAFRAISQKPIAAIVLTHHHADHVLGTQALLDAELARKGASAAQARPSPVIPVYAHESLVAEYARENGLIAELQTIRSAHMYGLTLGPKDLEGSNNGIGLRLTRGESGFVPPTVTVGERLEVTVAGVRMVMVHVPSEAESELALYLPDRKILLSAEVIQDHTFPNLYTIRGARYRDPAKWVQSIDLLRQWDADAMVLQHGPPVVGRDEVARVLRVYRDQIQFVHDQTIRYMNKGLPPSELQHVVTLPPHMRDERPWGRQYYGTVKHSVRGIYAGTVGWFAGDPVELDTAPPAESAKRLVALMGGRDRVLAEADRALDAGELQFAAELATQLIHLDTNDTQARHLKASAFRKLGYAQINANWRDYYLVSAMELDDQVPEAIYLALAQQTLGSALRGLPPRNQLDCSPTRLRAEETFDQEFEVGIRYRDTGAEFTLTLRRGVLEVADRKAARPKFALEVTRAAMGALLANAPLEEQIGSGEVALTGALADAHAFFALFEKPFTHKPEVVVR